MYDKVIITHLPTFYKNNLYKEINENQSIFVIYISLDTEETRSSDFTGLENVGFEHVILNTKSLQRRNSVLSTLRLLKLLSKIRYKEIILSGWDLLEFWVVRYFITNDKSLALESTIYDSSYIGLKGSIKKIFLAGIFKVYASGELHHDLLKILGYKGIVKITNGVGIINQNQEIVSKKTKKYTRDFLFIGRLTEVKNLDRLIEVFNLLENFNLKIIGTGDESYESKLKSISKGNIEFLGSVKNTQLKKYFSNTNFLILPSLSETWGLVIDEALFHGVPVIVSNKCGSVELVKDNFNGFLFQPENTEPLINIIKSIDNHIYDNLVKNINSDYILDKNKAQVNAYY
ncbi:glycosyltransferase [Vibrio sp. 10N.222.52.B7]|uniref:glycosyltransferase n=1 Tax=Vibrio sp. 10N.222.52.B7 TaxID=3229629 RepID=UPI00355406CC